ncbi:MAG: hypothetical protein EAZ51_06100 [Sphingobacteriales bacterium]|nr:MAG: hypothetical protein EAY66_04285 [Sphingobacteriales bacterium]TAF44532.1 MAG: hypothetical protein EAZ64_06565 [Sphingobacteriales bacterium]TAF80373.1 MAG: hypothetical protein EAZ51_06100 [Sphingobacteriales bacterium]
MKKNKSYRSDFLFTTPSFLIGAGSVLNIAGNYFSFNYSSSDRQADTKAISSDWGVVGGDIEKASDAILQNLKPANIK